MNTEPQTYKISTFGDIAELITEENVDRFLRDFNCLLRSLANVKNKTPVRVESFDWTDDNEVKITFVISAKPSF